MQPGRELQLRAENTAVKLRTTAARLFPSATAQPRKFIAIIASEDRGRGSLALQRPCENRFRVDIRPLSSCYGLRAALKCSCRSDSMARD